MFNRQKISGWYSKEKMAPSLLWHKKAKKSINNLEAREDVLADKIIYIVYDSCIDCQYGIFESENMAKEYIEKESNPSEKNYCEYNVIKKSSNNFWYKMAQEENISVEIPEIYKKTIDMLSVTASRLGLKAYAVGGFVRDLLLGKTPKDLDIMVDVTDQEKYIKNIKPIYNEANENPIKFIQNQIIGAKTITNVNNFKIDQSDYRPEFFRISCFIDYIDKSTKKPIEIKGELFETSINPSQLMAKQFDKQIPRGEAFGIFAVPSPIGEIEISYPRTERYTPGSRKPRTEMGNISQDAHRRDFGMNALFLDLQDNKIIDETGHGLQDIKDKIIRISDPKAIDIIFQEDPLRALRSIRQSLQLGFRIDFTIGEYIKTHPHLLVMKGDEITWDDETFKPKLSSERIAEEVRKIFSLPGASKAMKTMMEWGIIEHVFPLSSESEHWDMEHNNPHHYENIWDHTMTVMKKLDEYLEEKGTEVSKKDRLKMNLAAFLHDVGKLIPEKGFQDKKDEQGNVAKRSFIGHPEESAVEAQRMLERLKFSNNEISGIIDLVKYHDDVLNLESSKNQDYELAKIIKNIGKNVGDLLCLGLADRRAHIEGHNDSGYIEKALENVNQKYDELESRTKPFISREVSKKIPELLGVKDGPWRKILNDFIVENQMRELIKNEDQINDLINKLSIVSKMVGNSIDINAWLPYVLTANFLKCPSEESSVIKYLYENQILIPSLIGEEKRPLIEKYIDRFEIESMAQEMGFQIENVEARTIAREIFNLQAKEDIRNKEEAILFAKEKLQKLYNERMWKEPSQTFENNQNESLGKENMKLDKESQPNQNVKLAFSDKNQCYNSPFVLDNESMDAVIDLVIEEHEILLKDAQKKINWDRIASLLNDDNFLKEMKSYSKLNPEDMYKTYCSIRDENIIKYVSDILDNNIRIAQSGNFDTSQLESVFGSDIVNQAKNMVLSYNADLFSNIKSVGIKSGDFLGVYEPGENKRQNLEEYFRSYGILSGEDNPEVPNEIEKSDGTFFSVNPDKIIYEKDNLIRDIIGRGEISEDDFNFEIIKKFDEDQVLVLILGETITHESTHSKTDENGQPLGEAEAKAEEVKFLQWAIPQMEQERQSQGLPPLGLEIK